MSTGPHSGATFVPDGDVFGSGIKDGSSDGSPDGSSCGVDCAAAVMVICGGRDVGRSAGDGASGFTGEWVIVAVRWGAVRDDVTVAAGGVCVAGGLAFGP